MYRLWISTCCFIVCLIIHHSPSSHCAATAPSSSKQQQQQHQKEAKATDGQKKLTERPRSEEDVTFTKGSRSKRELTDEMKMAKRLRNFVGKRNWHLDSEDPPVESPGSPPMEVWFDTTDGKFYLSYPEDEELLSDSSIYTPYDDSMPGNIAKRLRAFVGKRGSTQFIGSQSGDGYPEVDQELELSKRLRNFVGKRIRGFVGKRDDFEKRMRHFVGKRMRHFVGKRDNEYDFGNDLLLQNKRPRRFVGKRLRPIVGKRDSGLDEDVGYPFDDDRENPLISSYPGKNPSSGNEWDALELPSPYSFDDGLGISADKRLRNFVGKRNMEDLRMTQKRLRGFVGKREDKRLRGFVGKRFDDAPGAIQFLNQDLLHQSKRLRAFVGKRSDRDTSAVERPM